MTPSWLQSHASYINSDRSTSASQITFNAGSTSNAALLKVQLIPAGALMDGTPLTVEITVANDISIGKRVDSDIDMACPMAPNLLVLSPGIREIIQPIAPVTGLRVFRVHLCPPYDATP